MTTKNHKILLIEDDPGLIELYKNYFSLKGKDLVVAEDGEAGLAAAKETLPALILLDLMMPKMNGMEVLKALKADPKVRDIPVYVLSNYLTQDQQQAAIIKGAVGYIVKSDIELTDLDGLVSKYV